MILPFRSLEIKNLHKPTLMVWNIPKTDVWINHMNRQSIKVNELPVRDNGKEYTAVPWVQHSMEKYGNWN